MNIIEQRLIYSEYSIGQIADDLGFSDESHLSRQFKKHKGITAAAFRKQFKS
jgi:AraC-like DNA-binding protein